VRTVGHRMRRRPRAQAGHPAIPAMERQPYRQGAVLVAGAWLSALLRLPTTCSPGSMVRELPEPIGRMAVDGCRGQTSYRSGHEQS
jgi:hypothetical protein